MPAGHQSTPSDIALLPLTVCLHLVPRLWSSPAALAARARPAHEASRPILQIPSCGLSPELLNRRSEIASESLTKTRGEPTDPADPMIHTGCATPQPLQRKLLRIAGVLRRPDIVAVTTRDDPATDLVLLECHRRGIDVHRFKEPGSRPSAIAAGRRRLLTRERAPAARRHHGHAHRRQRLATPRSNQSQRQIGGPAIVALQFDLCKRGPLR